MATDHTGGGLRELLRAEIRRGGPLPFSRFMELCLYHPVHGYYAAGGRVGRAGDFFTSVSVGEAFGGLLAAHCANLWRAWGRPGEFFLTECGANDGVLAEDILTAAAQDQPEFATRLRYRIVEPLPRLQALQRERLARWGGSVEWVTALAELRPEPGVVFGNELVDAFPVERVQFDGRRWRLLRVSEKRGAFRWEAAEPLNALADGFGSVAAAGGNFPAGYTTEFCPSLEAWVAAARRALTSGTLLLIDYGRPAVDYYAPHRTEGTLRGYRRHRREDDPLAFPGETDLTADVDFSALERAALRAGFERTELVSQERFVAGLAAERLRAMDGRPPDEAGKRWLRQLQTLMHPGHLGASFQAFQAHAS